MAFKLSQRSFQKLAGVDERLQEAVKIAIQHTKIDFGVICGMRSESEQRALYEKGASKTLKSRHLEGKAVDLMAYIQLEDGSSRASWEVKVYDEICDAMKIGATEVGVPIRWGSAWHIKNICDFNGTGEQMMNEYIDTRRAVQKRPFIDCPHFEIYE
tara:strand:- start:2244 stop:2714 length:471 start_codon:yes stop_codon:yes gene_type:complete